ncbi:MAG: DUF1232 domain-containing protein [Ignavibacteriaceae bacterium]|nr:MAG: DUF1232 domain-containing protein [Ignavibacteriaceae bacterium]MBW7873790.1 DUF1232 domain-containing protein [Ignavibacteria bacterium]MBZ0196976.1 DUF1232 domain-containing protein [Ignavibacteriaceae bacterium]OQY79295.1 MAG: hypothetical protein B6D45_01045 [Ignavibacteriales bacterium UTCHB3]
MDQLGEEHLSFYDVPNNGNNENGTDEGDYNFDFIENEAEFEKRAEFVHANIWQKLKESGIKISFVRDIVALVHYMTDPFVSWYRKAIVVAALIYFISPIDAIPDIAPLFGYMDDMGVIGAVLKFLGHELTSYYDS